MTHILHPVTCVEFELLSRESKWKESSQAMEAEMTLLRVQARVP